MNWKMQKMSEWNQKNNQNINNLDRARMLRKEAMLLEEKERVKSRLAHLLSISEDEYYSRYLGQMLRDLESGKASPAQVEREAQRSYNAYRQKMTQVWKTKAAPASENTGCPMPPAVERAPLAEQNLSAENKSQKSTIEFKIGTHVFSIIGAIFVLAAFAISGFYFWGGIGTMAVTLLIATGIIFIGRKKDSAALRIISLVSCYVCFFAMREFGTEFNFLLIAGMLLIVNGISIFFQNGKHRNFINVMHILILTLGTSMFTGIAWSEEIHSVYLAFYVITSFLLVNVLSLKECAGKNESIFPACCIGNTVLLMLLLGIGSFGPEMSEPDMALFMHITVEILILAVCLVVFMLWDKSDGKRWAQLYYGAVTVALSGSFSEYPLEILLSGLGVFLVVKLFSVQKENMVLDILATLWTAFLAFRLTDNWYCWVLAGALLLSAVRIKYLHIFYELVITLSLLLIWGIRYHDCLRVRYALSGGWFYLLSAGVLLFLFLLFNHLPCTGKKEQLGYNIINVAAMAFYYLGVWFSPGFVFSSVMMVLGAVTILVVFRPRYKMGIPGKYLVLAGFLTWFSLTGHYESPVVTSILLMVISLGSVGIGFKIRSKAERICGLIMAAFVSLKLVLYDFREVEIIYKVLVFLVVGVMALLISFLYVRLQKGMELLEEKTAESTETAKLQDSDGGKESGDISVDGSGCELGISGEEEI